jgi:site-specific recombinase XerD
MKGNFKYTEEDYKLYNEEIKKEYLDTFGDKTAETYKRIFFRSGSLEEKLNKDMGEFNSSEVEKVMTELNPLTVSASRSNFSAIKSYITWAIENGHRSNNINPLTLVPKDWFKQFVDKNVMIYISKHELDQLTDENHGCKNSQDGVLFQLLFEGVDIHSICHLMKKDVDYDNNTLTLRDKEGNVIRENYEVSRDCIALLRKAAEEKEYYKRNMEAEILPNQSPITLLVDNDYVIRVGATRNSDPMGAVSPHVIYRRLSTISELFENPYLTSKNIYRSGQIFMGYELYKRDGVLDKDQYIEIAEHYQMPKVKNGKYEFYNWSSLKEWINMQNISKLYDI